MQTSTSVAEPIMAAYAPKIPSIPPYAQELEGQPEPVVAFGREYPNGHLVERHHHDRAQLIYASRGIMRVDTDSGIWVVPPMRAIWMPPQIDHEIRAASAISMRTLFIRPGLRSSLPRECCVVEVSPLLRELILRMVELTDTGQLDASSVHLIEIILDEIREIQTLPLRIPMPTDPRALRICQSVLDNPADGRTSAQWGASVGASTRTLERLFRNETGLSFGSWRRQVCLLAAMSRLAANIPVATVARDLGYESAGAFTVMFKRTLGRSPSEFLR